MEANENLIDACIGDVRRARRGLRGKDGKMVEDPNSVYRQVRRYFDMHRMGRTDQLSAHFGVGIPTLRAAMQSVRQTPGGDEIKTLEQPQGGHGLYYRESGALQGLLVRNPDDLRIMGLPQELLLPMKPSARVMVMLHLGVVNPNSMTAVVMQRLSENALSTRELASALDRESVRIGNVFNNHIVNKLPLFGLKLVHRPANKFGLGRAQSYSLEAEKVEWEWNEEYLACDKKVEQLFLENWTNFLGFTARIVGNQELAEEAIQDLFTKLLLKARVDPKASMEQLHKNYIYTCLKNKAMGYKRTGRGKNIHIELDALVENHYSQSDLFPHAPSPETLLGIYETRNTLFAALKSPKLSKETKDAIDLHYLKGMPVKDIAAKCGVSSGTISSRLNRGRNLLRSVLGQGFFS